ncbi:class IIb bacteriocin, lactobin A/cerein 7B family [Spirosoma montaniterrae]|nr:class IIb bacteriocin, lactobin A/cerein 7B family [Spirosoma montaniterrae]
MATFNFDQAEVVELNANELEQVQGGNPFLLGVIVGLLLSQR